MTVEPIIRFEDPSWFLGMRVAYGSIFCCSFVFLLWRFLNRKKFGRLGKLSGVLLGTLLFIGVWLLAERSGNQFRQKHRYEFQAQRLVFAGKVIDSETGQWPNDRLVLLFLKNKEVARATTKLMEFSVSEQGITDGVFVIQANNDYKLSLQDIDKTVQPELEIDIGQAIEVVETTPFLGRPRTKKAEFTLLYAWIDNMEEGKLFTLPVPSKNTVYQVMALEGNLEDLPSAILSGPLELREDGTLLATLGDTLPGEATGNASVETVSTATEVETVELNKIVVPINNCGGSARVEQSYTYSQTYIHEYHAEMGGSIGGEVPLAAWLSLTAELEARYGFEQGEISTQTVEYKMAAEPDSNQVYTITWKEEWQSGTAEIDLEGTTVTIPFRAKTNLIYEIESTERECN